MGFLTATDQATWSTTAAAFSIVAALFALAMLAALHVASPEFGPSWRMVSEYANGKHSWLLSLMFAGWSLAALCLAYALLPLGDTWLGRIGLFFLVLAGIGPMMAAFFDINHSLHGLATVVGVPTLPIAAILLTIAMNRRDDLPYISMWPAHSTWISLLLMAAGMALLLISLKRAGIDISGQSGPLAELPPGAIAFVGWANRLLVLCHVGWIGFVAWTVLRGSGVR